MKAERRKRQTDVATVEGRPMAETSSQNTLTASKPWSCLLQGESRAPSFLLAMPVAESYSQPTVRMKGPARTLAAPFSTSQLSRWQEVSLRHKKSRRGQERVAPLRDECYRIWTPICLLPISVPSNSAESSFFCPRKR